MKLKDKNHFEEGKNLGDAAEASPITQTQDKQKGFEITYCTSSMKLLKAQEFVSHCLWPSSF